MRDHKYEGKLEGYYANRSLEAYQFMVDKEINYQKPSPSQNILSCNKKSQYNIIMDIPDLRKN